VCSFFFFQAEDGIRDRNVTGVQTCALPIYAELASVVSNMSSEPNVTPQIREAAFRLLCLNHTFTSYISALGAHREQLTNPEILRSEERRVGKECRSRLVSAE